VAGLGVQPLSMRVRGAIQAGSLLVFVLSKDTDAILEGVHHSVVTGPRLLVRPLSGC
jgi:hypothetical protein